MSVNEVGESSSQSFFFRKNRKKQRARKRQIYSHLLSLEEVSDRPRQGQRVLLLWTMLSSLIINLFPFDARRDKKVKIEID